MYNLICIFNRLVCMLLFLGCGLPEFASDSICNDENNNAGCNWDGGACCNRQDDGWNTYCTECKCLRK